VFRFWKRKTTDVFLQDPWLLPLLSCQTPGGMGSVDDSLFLTGFLLKYMFFLGIIVDVVA